MVICTAKAEKNERIPRNTKLSPGTKSWTSEVWGDAAERGCVISLGCFSTVPKTHGVSNVTFTGETNNCS